jgi:hypothetical protein
MVKGIKSDKENTTDKHLKRIGELSSITDNSSFLSGNEENKDEEEMVFGKEEMFADLI